MPTTWGEQAARYLDDSTVCPRCSWVLQRPEVCDNCNAVLTGDTADELREASAAAHAALLRRESLIGSLESAAVVTPAPAPHRVMVPATLAETLALPPLAASPGSSSQVSVQSVMAVAGAGLFGVAAIVFTFLNPDLTSFGTRTAIIGVITVLFVLAAWYLSRRRLQFSAEAVGALGAVFLALDVWALSEYLGRSIDPWFVTGVASFLAAGALILLARWVGLRSWLWLGVVALTLTPLAFGIAGGGTWWMIAATIAVAYFGFAAQLRLTSAHGFERASVTALQVIAVTAAVIQLLAAFRWETTVAVGAAVAFAALAVFSVLASRHDLPRLWSGLVGVFAVVSVSALAFTTPDPIWALLLVLPLAGGLAAVGVMRMPLPSTVTRPLAHGGALTVAAVAAIPAAFVVISQCAALLLQLIVGAVDEVQGSFVGAEFGLAASVGLAVGGLGMLGVWLLRRGSTVASAALALASWMFALAVLGVAGWSAWLRPTQIVIALVATLAVVALLTRVPLFVRARASVKAPLYLLEYALVLLIALVGWADSGLIVIGGIAAILGIAAIATTVPASLRPLHLAVGFAYSLIIFGAALSLAGAETLAVLCLTASLGSLVGLAATLTRRLGARYWYAILIVTAVPFFIAVVSVIAVRSGWTGLSTAVTFALALTLVVSRREGLNRPLRALAGALLVPSLAVVVICLGAEFILVSASPITLPVIAAIVAIVLPASGLIRDWLVRHGVPETDARLVRLAIEASSLVTAAIAVLLALVRAAAGLPTSLTVLLIVGVGAVATALFARRRYGWVVAALSFSGALWCLWALFGVTTVEAYTLPPALGLAVVGGVAAVRRWKIEALGWIGIVGAILPTLVLLGVVPGDAVPRAALLIGTAAVLLVAAVILRSRLEVLVAPLGVAAIMAAAAAPLQGLLWAWDANPFDGLGRASVMLPVLLLGVVGLVIAGGAGILLARASSSRWLLVPGILYLLVGPAAAIRPGWLSILTVYGLMAALLVLLLVTVVRSRRGATVLPPVWFTFALAWCMAVVSWSERELRVEAYSLPLGLVLLAAGIIAMRPVDAPATLTSWPTGFTGSWYLLAPGILVTLVPSVLATGTDPRTERAILVIALALIAILIGAVRKLAAPFILGLIVLPIENVVVFSVQVGDSIGAMPWWITLATAGAVLLVIAVTSERREAGNRGVAARLRDLT